MKKNRSDESIAPLPALLSSIFERLDFLALHTDHCLSITCEGRLKGGYRGLSRTYDCIRLQLILCLRCCLQSITQNVDCQISPKRERRIQIGSSTT